MDYEMYGIVTSFDLLNCIVQHNSSIALIKTTDITKRYLEQNNYVFVI